ncbi:MAG: hypothetical protein QNJ84_04940 [Alphaproteobacteria bacterium]|nr:hypothetical protein [Alphaproteobacteria bacterium]
MYVEQWTQRANRAKRAAHQVLASHGSAPSRIVSLEDLSSHLSGSPVDVQDYFGEAILCLEHELYRSAIVLAWAGHFRVFAEVCFEAHGEEIKVERPKWKFENVTELTEAVPESQILVVARDVKFISKTNHRILDGQLSRRNQCAHPTVYRPSMNTALGYVDEMIRQTLSYLANQRNKT